jgi:hypothetical protein
MTGDQIVTDYPHTLLAEDVSDGLRFAGRSFVTLRGPRECFGQKLAHLAAKRPPLTGLRRSRAPWVKPELVVGVRHLRGEGAFRPATVQTVVGEPLERR